MDLGMNDPWQQFRPDVTMAPVAAQTTQISMVLVGGKVPDGKPNPGHPQSHQWPLEP